MEKSKNTGESLLDVFKEQRSRLRSYLFRITANKEDTEDLLQDTWLKASEKLHTFQGRSSLATWLFSIATNLAKDLLRSKKRWPVNAMDLAKEASMKHPEIYMKRFFEIHQTSAQGAFEINEHINFCFTCTGKTLPVEQQVAILLKEVFDFKIREIAVILDESEAVIKHLLHNGRTTMQSIFNHRCSLINKEGTCYQCSELNGIFNPGQDTQEQLIKNTLHKQAADKTPGQLFEIRAKIAKAIDPYESKGADLQFCHFDHVWKTVDAGEIP